MKKSDAWSAKNKLFDGIWAQESEQNWEWRIDLTYYSNASIWKRMYIKGSLFWSYGAKKNQ
jgi:hypothetical protein